MPSGFGNVERDGYQGDDHALQDRGRQARDPLSQDPYAVTFYKLGDTYYAARSNEFGYANYEIIPAPQIAANPLTALSNQFSIELGLTEEQKKQIVPMLQQEMKQLRRAEEGHLAQRPAEGGGVAQARRLLRREDHAAAQSGAAAEVPGHARADAAADDRGDGRQGAAEGGSAVSMFATCTSSAEALEASRVDPAIRSGASVPRH